MPRLESGLLERPTSEAPSKAWVAAPALTAGPRARCSRKREGERVSLQEEAHDGDQGEGDPV